MILLQFLLAHVLGDFVLQTQDLVKKRKQQFPYMLLHIAIHAGAMLLIFASELSAWWGGIVFVLITHLGIDCLKVWYERRWPKKPMRTFIIDQALHLGMIVLVMCYYFPVHFSSTLWWNPQTLSYLLTILTLLSVTPIIMRTFFTKWDQEQAFTGKKTDTLLDAGLLIGILERGLVVLFIHLNFLSGIGFLLAAKSIFRFGDLTKSKEAKFTEYVLVGTFLSYTMAILIGVVSKQLIDYFNGLANC